MIDVLVIFVNGQAIVERIREVSNSETVYPGIDFQKVVIIVIHYQPLPFASFPINAALFVNVK